MPRSRHDSTSDDQLTLALTGDGYQEPTETRGLFSKAYVTRHIRDTGPFASATESAAAYDLVSRQVREHVDALRRRGEAFTCSTLLEPVLDALGWRRIPQEMMPPGNLGMTKRPDYCLFSSDARVRELGEALRAGAPAYLRPSAQGILLETPADCLEVIEKSVNWEAEKLYGVEGQGPFDEF